MRKQPRLTALLAVPLLTSAVLTADLLATADAAEAAPRRTRAAATRRYKPRRPRRPQAPPTAENLARLRQCESNGNYSINTGNGYFGAYQFSPRTWSSLGYGGLPHEAAPEVQDEAARRLQERSGWGQWPACSRRLRLR